MAYPRLSEKEKMILEALVNHGELYGLQMVDIIPGLKRGTVYVTLGRMEDKGFVTGREVKEPQWAGMPRRLYKITGQGQRVLQALMAYENALRGKLAHAQ